MSQRLLISTLATGIAFFFSLLTCLWFQLPLLLAVIVPTLLAAGLLAVWSPLWLLCSLIVVRMSLDYFGDTVSIPLTQNLSVTLSQGIGISVALLGILAFALHREVRSGIRFAIPMIIVCIWGIVSLLVSISPGDTLRELLRIFDIIALTAIASAAVRTDRDYRLLLGSIFASSLLPISVGIYQYINGIGLSDDAVSIPRIFGTFSHPNTFSLYLFALIAAVTLAFAVRKDRRPLPLFGLLLLSSVFSSMLIITYARVAWVSLFIFLVFLTITRFRMLLIPLVMIPFLLYLSILPLQERVDSMFHADPGSSVAWRQLLWTMTVHNTLSDGTLLIGSGMSTFPIIAEQLHEPTISYQDAHNDFVKFFVEGGIVGLLVYLAFLVTLVFPLLRRAWNTHVSQSKTSEHLVFLILFGLVLSLIAASLSDNVFKNTPVQWLLWILIGASFGLFEQKKEVSKIDKKRPAAV